MKALETRQNLGSVSFREPTTKMLRKTAFSSVIYLFFFCRWNPLLILYVISMKYISKHGSRASSCSARDGIQLQAAAEVQVAFLKAASVYYVGLYLHHWRYCGNTSSWFLMIWCNLGTSQNLNYNTPSLSAIICLLKQSSDPVARWVKFYCSCIYKHQE